MTESILSSAVQTKLNAAGSGSVADDTITAAKLQSNSVTAVKIQNGAIDETKLAAAVVTKLNAAPTIADGSLTATKLVAAVQSSLGKADTALQLADIAGKADDAAVLHKAGSETITGTKNFTGGLSSGGSAVVVDSDARLTDQRVPIDSSVTTSKLQDSAVTTAKLVDGAVTASKLAPGTFSTVATSGSYADLITKPTIPATASDIGAEPAGLSSATQTSLSAAFAPRAPQTAVKTSMYTAAAGEIVRTDATVAPFTITLPTAPADRSRVTVKKLDATTNAVSVALGGSDRFNTTTGTTTSTLNLMNQALTVQYDSATSVWLVVSDDLPLSQTDARYAERPVASRNSLTSYFHATGFGVKADGLTDDTAALQACINAAQAAGPGNTVYLPKGTILTTGITLAQNKLVRLQGMGIGYVGGDAGTKILRNGAGTAVLLQGIGDPTTLTNVGDPTKRCRVEIYDLELNGNNTAGEVLNIFRGSQVRIERVRVRNSAGIGAHFTQLFNSSFSQLFISYSGNGTVPALLLDGTSGEGTAAGGNTIHFDSCEWETNAGTDIKIDGSSADIAPTAGVTFTNIKIERGNGEYPLIDMQYCHTVSFIGLYGYVGSSATALVQHNSNLGTSNRISSSSLANGGFPAYHLAHTSGWLQLSSVRFSGTPTTGHVQISSGVPYNAHEARNVSGDVPSKLYVDGRGAGAFGVRIVSLPLDFSSTAFVAVGNAGAGVSFAHGTSTPFVSGIFTIPNDALVGGTAGIVIRWCPSTTTGGNVQWAAIAQDVTTASVISSGGATSTVTTAAGTTAFALKDSPGPGLTVNPGHMMRFKLYRDGINAADTYADPAYLVTAHLQYQYSV
ncbi:glycosyl hydrolase family 28-related protein [Subtercola frigoramans]|uniref:Rhamnogalacturonase A/B/Epimerase-like pectate lyase domain-containing protein n=1 Tax=Subtercola frigoramans TaxID=120298 RepID=A0ABS2L6F5_9MICO|nr:glycosyl hydrolase family 28-related protein [Subtercola frigoramans]MBM7472491.1 hypothetical protein [Subtercola frigoramans]